MSTSATGVERATWLTRTVVLVMPMRREGPDARRARVPRTTPSLVRGHFPRNRSDLAVPPPTRSRENQRRAHLDSRTPRLRFHSVRAAVQLDQLDLVAVRILDERDRRAAVFHRSGLACHLDACGPQLLDLGVDAVHPEREVTEARPDVVPVGVPVVRELDDGLLGFRPVADER